MDGRDAVNAAGAGDALHGGERDGAVQVSPEPDPLREKRTQRSRGDLNR